MVGVLGAIGVATAEVGQDGGRIVGSLGVIPEYGTPVSGQSYVRLRYRRGNNLHKVTSRNDCHCVKT